MKPTAKVIITCKMEPNRRVVTFPVPVGDLWDGLTLIQKDEAVRSYLIQRFFAEIDYKEYDGDGNLKEKIPPTKRKKTP